MFNFTMNGIIWMIKEVSQETFWEDDHKIFKDDGDYFFGRCKVDTNEIWLWKDINNIAQQRRTLYHELMHAYLNSYVSFSETEYTCEVMCDLCANSHDIIHEIVINYFKQKWGVNSEEE